MPSQLDLSLGAVEIGVLLSSVLWGVTTVQLYLYLITPHKDPWWTKTLVYIIWILESFHTIFAWMYLYRLTVTFYGVPATLAESDWTLSLSSLFDGIIGAIVQMFFAYRVHLFSKTWMVTGVCWLGSLLQLACTVAVTILTPTIRIAVFTVKYGWIVQSILIINLIVDILNTSSLTFYLSRQRSGFKGTDQYLQKLVVWTIETGFLTSLAALIQVVLFKVEPSTSLWIGISIFYAKLYSNSFYAILNSRSTILVSQGLRTHVLSDSGLNFAARNWDPSVPSYTENGVHVAVITRNDVEMEGTGNKDTMSL